MENNASNLRDLLWRRKLSGAERSALRTQPEVEMEARLTEVLSKIPNAAAPSNFTARVLDAIEREEKQAARSSGRWNWRLLLPRVAVAAAVVVFVGVELRHYEVNSHRKALANNVALMAVTQPPPSLDALENLDAIQRMSQSNHADGELLAALQ